jgi:hypothetical protein
LENIKGSIPDLVCVTIDIGLEEEENKLVRFYGTVTVADYRALHCGMIRNIFIKAVIGAFQ